MTTKTWPLVGWAFRRPAVHFAASAPVTVTLGKSDAIAATMLDTVRMKCESHLHWETCGISLQVRLREALAHCTMRDQTGFPTDIFDFDNNFMYSSLCTEENTPQVILRKKKKIFLLHKNS